MDLFELALLCLGVAAVAFTCVWAASLVLEDASIVDVFWGPGFALVALTAAVAGRAEGARPWLVLTLVGLWGLRLGTHIFLRNRGHGEDPRYARWRSKQPDTWWWKSLIKVFLVQAALLWVVAAPIQIVGATRGDIALRVWDYVGAAVWLVGFLFETVGDLQLTRFKSDPANKGEVMDRGLWRYTRHPNYFGDAVAWWGIGVVALAVPFGWTALFGPALMTFLLVRVSGVSMLEKDISDRRPGYREYVATTNAFIPGPRKG